MKKKKPIKDMAKRESESLVIHKPIICGACRETSSLFSKVVGYHPYQWEMNCTLCHRHGAGLNGHVKEHIEVIELLNALRSHYISGSSSAELSTKLEGLADQYDHLLHNSRCECGGSLSIAAKPKCIHCDLEIYDSYFHYVDYPIDPGRQ